MLYEVITGEGRPPQAGILAPVEPHRDADQEVRMGLRGPELPGEGLVGHQFHGLGRHPAADDHPAQSQDVQDQVATGPSYNFV